MQFSLMIPVYNAEAYLEACLASVAAQTFADFEVLIVDDGSSDRSGAICDLYAENDRRFRVWHTTNHGVFSARAFAEAHARGDYLLFLDADDLAEPALLQALHDAVEQHHPDLLTFDFRTFRENETPQLETFLDADAFLTGAEMEPFYRFLLSTRFNAVWNKCFHRRLISCAPDYAAFKGLRHGEDLLRSAYLLTGAQTLCYIHEPLYRYRVGGGFAGRFDADSLVHTDKVDETVRRLLSDKVDFDASWQADYNDLCRKQLDNYVRLLAYGKTPVSEGAALLQNAMRTHLAQNALSAADDSLKYRLLRRGRYRTLLRLYRGRGRLHAQ